MIARRQLLGMTAGLAFAGTAAAQAPWPNRPVKLIVTFPPGGASDAAARVVAGPLSDKLGQTVIVDNKPGGGTTIGANFVLAAKDDYHTLMLSNSAPLSIAPYLFDKPPYDPIKDFSHVVYIGSVANAFVVRPAVPAKTMPELIAWIKGQGKPVPFGSGGQGSIGHIIGEMFKAELGLNMEHIGYRGAAPMFQDMMAGQLDFAVVTLTEVLPLAKDGKLRMIALTSTQKAPICARRAIGHRARLPEACGRELRRHLRARRHAGRRAGQAAQGRRRGFGRSQDRRTPGRSRLCHQAYKFGRVHCFRRQPGQKLPGAGEGVGRQALSVR